MSIFKFQQFQVNQTHAAMKIGTDAMVFGAYIAAKNATRALDIGTGTGVLSLMVAQKNPSVHIQAIEIELNAFNEAKSNFEASPFSTQLQVIHQDFLAFQSEQLVDLIFTNPPYFTNSSKSGVENRNKARHTDELPFEQLIAKVSSLLSQEGFFWIILPVDAFEIIQQLTAEHQLYLVKEISIFGKKNQLVRKIGVFSFHEQHPIFEAFIIRDEDNSYTSQYISLTKDFHAVDLRKKSGR
jgi:tRNA1Val (adenine37-N6)-methyltransferase